MRPPEARPGRAPGLTADGAGSPVSRLALLLAALLIAVGLSAWSPTPVQAGDEDTNKPAEPEGQPITRDIQTSKEHFEAAEVKREEQLWGEAATLFWKAVESDVLNYRAHVRYQETGRRAGDDLDAMKADYKSFVEDYPKNVCFKLHRLRLDPPARRLEALAKLVKSYGKSSDVHLEVGRAHLAAGAAKPALEALTKALALKVGDRPDVMLLLAEAEWAAGKGAKAVERLDAAIRGDAEFFSARLALARFQMHQAEYDKSAVNAEIVLTQRPTYIAAFLLRAESLSSAGKIEEAKGVLDAAYRANKGVADVTIALADTWARFEDDSFLEREGSKEKPEFKEAIKLYQEVLAANEENARALYGLAWVLERQAKFEEAEEKYRAVSSIQPESVMAVNSIGYCLFKQGRVTEAQVQFKRALDMDSEFVTAMANLGSTYDAQAKYQDAIKLYEKILKQKKYQDYMRAVINCAFDYEALGRFPKALKLLQQAHEKLPKDANIVVWIGDNYYFQKKWKDAETSYQKAVGMDDKSFFGWRGLGLTLSQRKRWADAVSALEKAAKIKPDDLDMLVMLGDIYFLELDDLTTALKKYQEYVQRGGTDPEVQDAILEIRKELDKK